MQSKRAETEKDLVAKGQCIEGNIDIMAYDIAIKAVVEKMALVAIDNAFNQKFQPDTQHILKDYFFEDYEHEIITFSLCEGKNAELRANYRISHHDIRTNETKVVQEDWFEVDSYKELRRELRCFAIGDI